jgi:nicotinamidase-related amidase
VIDVSYGFTGDKPEPILDSIKQWRNSCGAESWTAIAVIKDLADLFRSKRLPVIYSTGFLRQDNWDAGGWAWKNNRTAESAPVESTNRDPDEIVSELAPQPQDIVVYKQKPSVFFGSNLISYLTLLGCDSLIVTGCTTSGCVRATVVDAFSYNIRVAVAEDACFDRSEASHASACATCMRNMPMLCQRVKLGPSSLHWLMACFPISRKASQPQAGPLANTN